MRLIKFRYVFKHIHTGNIEIKTYSLSQLEDTLTKFLSPVFDHREYELLGRNQYTGLKDINGVEIYENDIIYHHHSDREYRLQGVVRYEEKWAGFYFAENRGMNTNTRYKVLGNTYENSELIAQ